MNRRSAIALASALLCSGFGLSGVAVAQQTGTAADPVPKEAYVTRVGDQGCAVGYYK